ncbi:MAG: hypothetical protein HYU77_02345 [Betaproteobacteria bacterium]|nr:hypothetical protein [Betaproteobacteria bacterium]
MKALKWLAVAFVILLALAVALPFLIPLGTYIPVIEKQASGKLKEPVKVGTLRSAFFPVSQLTIGNIAVGRGPDIQVKSVSVVPDLASLFGAVKVLRVIELDGVTVTQDALAKIPVWTKGDGSPAAVAVRRITFSDVTLKLKQGPLGPFEGEVRLAAAGGLEQARLQTTDGKAKLTAQPEKQDRYAVQLNARNWKLPAGPALVFDELNASGHATANDLVLLKIAAKLYGGSADGNASLNWQKNYRLKGDLTTKQVELEKLVSLFNPEVKVSGKLNSKSAFSSRAANAGQLADAMRLETDFDVKDGVFYGVDIAEAAKSVVKGGTKGGQTKFDNFTGHMLMERGAFRFTNLDISSGVLAATGNVDISPKKELNGKISAEVKAGVSLATVPLNVSGTVKDPTLRPTGAAIAGAAAGTAILGPGVGTTLGTKAGAFFDNLFGKKEEKPAEKKK